MRADTGSRHVLATLRALVLGSLLFACERAEPSSAAVPAPNFADIQAGIFATECALSGCHRGGSAPLGLDLSPGSAAANLVNVPSAEVPALLRVAPGNPDDSYLVIKIEGGPRIASGTARMPLGRAPLSAAQIQAIRQWIASGAQTGN